MMLAHTIATAQILANAYGERWWVATKPSGRVVHSRHLGDLINYDQLFPVLPSTHHHRHV